MVAEPQLRPGGAWVAPIGRCLLVLCIMVMVAAGCSSSGGSTTSDAPPETNAGPAAVFVALGAKETNNRDRDDLQDNWPQIVFAETIPSGGVYVNLATDDATVQSALDAQLPQATALHPTMATVWIESSDARLGTPAAVYRQKLTALVEGLRAAGATQILLLTPATSRTDAGGDLADSVAQVAKATGATLVALGDVSDRADDAGQRRIADLVSGALRGS